MERATLEGVGNSNLNFWASISPFILELGSPSDVDLVLNLDFKVKFLDDFAGRFRQEYFRVMYRRIKMSNSNTRPRPTPMYIGSL